MVFFLLLDNIWMLSSITTVLAIIYGFRAFYIIEERQTAIVTRFGKVIEQWGPGHHFNLAWFNVVKGPFTTAPFIFNPKPYACTTSDGIPIDLDITAKLKLTDARRRYENSYKNDYNKQVESIFQTAAVQIIGLHQVDSLLASGPRSAIEKELAEHSKKYLTDLGYQLEQLRIENLRTPKYVRDRAAKLASQRLRQDNAKILLNKRQDAQKLRHELKRAKQAFDLEMRDQREAQKRRQFEEMKKLFGDDKEAFHLYLLRFAPKGISAALYLQQLGN